MSRSVVERQSFALEEVATLKVDSAAERVEANTVQVCLQHLEVQTLNSRLLSAAPVQPAVVDAVEAERG